MASCINKPEDIPTEIWEHVLQIAEVGDALQKVETNRGTEWWLSDFDGNLIDAYWMEDIKPKWWQFQSRQS